MIDLKKGVIQRLFICDTMQVKHIPLFILIKVQSLSEFVIVLFYCKAFLIIINNNYNEPN